MASDGQMRSLGRFLYTQNPFYLISCALILYGLQLARHSYGDLFSQSMFLTAGISAYLLLMAITAVAVIRLGKVWDDARTILLVVLIGQFALSTGVDELCNWDWKQAAYLLAAGALFSVLTTELVLRLCRMRLPSWYRLSYYGLLLVFYATPPLLGYAVAERHSRLSSWGAPLFSVLVALTFLLLVPAVQQGRRLLRRNGTPWRWPLYPLSAFVIIVVLAGIRTHAIWMSFGYLGAAARFEPFLLLPLAFAMLVLLVESDRTSARPICSYIAMALAPAMLLCGVSGGGMSYLPIQHDLQLYFGSAFTVALMSLVLFYVYISLRQIPSSVIAVIGSLVALAVLGEMPETAESEGIRNWMVALIGSLVCLLSCLRNFRSDKRWLGFAVVTCLTILMAGQAYQQERVAAISAAVFATVAMLAIGACFDTELAALLRHVAAACLVAAAIGVVVWHVRQSPGILAVAILVLMCGVTLAYLPIVKRLGWLYVIGVQAACLLSIVSFDGYHAGTFSGANLPIQSGLLCFAIGATISSFKTGVCRRVRERLPEADDWPVYRTGL